MDTSSLPLPRLPLARYRLRFRATDPLRLPDYAGSAWRGAFGRALKRLVCVTRERHCPDCLLYRSCAYPYVFETPAQLSDSMLSDNTAAPHPFVLLPAREPQGVVAPGAEVALGLTLFGHGNRQLPYIIHALDQAAQHGIGQDRGVLELIEVRQATADDTLASIYRPGERLTPLPEAIPDLPSCPARLQITVETPLRLKRRGHHVTPETFTFDALFGNLLRRISLLTRFHAENALETDFAGLSRAAHAVSVHEPQLRWQDWTRYSSRQNTTMQLGGLLGTFRLEGTELGPFWPYLWLGQWTHAGKNTSMGLGAYRIEPCEPRD